LVIRDDEWWWGSNISLINSLSMHQACIEQALTDYEPSINRALTEHWLSIQQVLRNQNKKVHLFFFDCVPWKFPQRNDWNIGHTWENLADAI
jgi:hypothetical protein